MVSIKINGGNVRITAQREIVCNVITQAITRIGPIGIHTKVGLQYAKLWWPGLIEEWAIVIKQRCSSVWCIIPYRHIEAWFKQIKINLHLSFNNHLIISCLS